MHSSASSNDATIWRAFGKKCAPSSVSSMRLVVRFSSITPKSSSSRDSARLTPDAVWPRSSAAALREPASTTPRNTRNASEFKAM
ncbi:hypothetical protein D3C87_1815480 [compost metagenome]